MDVGGVDEQADHVEDAQAAGKQLERWRQEVRGGAGVQLDQHTGAQTAAPNDVLPSGDVNLR